jgi:hypothetical protein
MCTQGVQQLERPSERHTRVSFRGTGMSAEICQCQLIIRVALWPVVLGELSLDDNFTGGNSNPFVTSEFGVAQAQSSVVANVFGITKLGMSSDMSDGDTAAAVEMRKKKIFILSLCLAVNAVREEYFSKTDSQYSARVL